MRSERELKELLAKTQVEYEALFGEPWPTLEMHRLFSEFIKERRIEFLRSRPIGHMPQDDSVKMERLIFPAAHATIGFPKLEIKDVGKQSEGPDKRSRPAAKRNRT